MFNRFWKQLLLVTGVSVLQRDESCRVPSRNRTRRFREKTQISDVSLATDFIAEGLEYIDEIEVNILNLEQNPERYGLYQRHLQTLSLHQRGGRIS